MVIVNIVVVAAFLFFPLPGRFVSSSTNPVASSSPGLLPLTCSFTQPALASLRQTLCLAVLTLAVLPLLLFFSPRIGFQRKGFDDRWTKSLRRVPVQ